MNSGEFLNAVDGQSFQSGMKNFSSTDEMFRDPYFMNLLTLSNLSFTTFAVKTTFTMKIV